MPELYRIADEEMQVVRLDDGCPRCHLSFADFRLIPWKIDRVQRSRKPGSKLPPHTLCVGRGTMFGNRIASTKRRPNSLKFRFDGRVYDVPHDRAKKLFYEWIRQPSQKEIIEKFLSRCRDERIEHLACWCRNDMPCGRVDRNLE